MEQGVRKGQVFRMTQASSLHKMKKVELPTEAAK